MHPPTTRPALPMPSLMSALLLISLASSFLSLPFVVDATPSNKYNASLLCILPPSLANLSQLSHLDLSANEFHGPIPPELGRLCNLTLLRIDNNGLTLEIPDEITSLHGLVFLNLSRNRLSGNIPELIGQLNWLESLDLSLNQLSGTIPPSISSLNFLSSLNLSNNKLSGRIPSGNQLQTLNDPSIYIGNYGLCGPPLTENCSEDGTQVTPDGDGNEPGDDGDEDDTIWSYLGMSLGISVGFWGVCIILIFKKSWRVAYFHYVDNMQDMLSQMFLRNSY